MEKIELDKKMEELKLKKQEILDSIFISKEEAEFYKSQKETLLIIEITELKNKLDDVINILGGIMRSKCKEGDTLSQDIFEEFCKVMDKKTQPDLMREQAYHKHKLKKIEDKLNSPLGFSPNGHA